MTLSIRRSQAGFGLLETSLVVVILAVISAAALSALTSAQRSGMSPQITADMENVQNVIRGYSRLNLHLPEPDKAVGKLETPPPGYLVGIVPRDTGTSSDQPIRYLVNAALVDKSRLSVSYLTDPSKLLLDHKIESRTVPNGLDFCLALINQEQSNQALPDGRRVAYALQSPKKGGPALPEKFQLSESPQLETRFVGYVELAADLGCFNVLSDLTSAVKDAAVYVDAHRLAEQGVATRQLLVKSAMQAIDWLDVRLAVWIAAEITNATNAILTNAQLWNEGKLSWSKPGILYQITRNAANIAIAGYYIDDTKVKMQSAKESLVKTQIQLKDSEIYRDSLKSELEIRLANIQAIQSKGLN